MRFEVKSGGVTAIVFAMTLLSGVVFVMGLLAGYDVGRQAQLDAAQLATSYPLQSAPSPDAASNPSPAEPAKPATQSAALTTAPPPTAGTAPATSPSGTDRGIAGDSVGARHELSQPSAAPTRKRLASSSIPSTAAPPSSPAADSPAAGEDIGAATESENLSASDELSRAPSNPDLQSRRAVASTAPSVRHKPYNIQIQAAMDISGADKMMARLQKLGYRSHLVPTEIAGQRWYKIEVGPYATAEEASSAEAQLRQKYDATYGGAGRDNTPGEASAGDNYEE